MGRYYSSFLIFCALASRSPAYPTPVDVDGALHTWSVTRDAPDVYFEVISEDSSMTDFLNPVVTAAAGLWNEVEHSTIKLRPSTSDHPAQISIHFKASITGGDKAAGYSVFDKVQSGKPEHCSVHISVTEDSDYLALHKTTLHEMGHCIGLGHSLIANSIMSYELEKNDFALSLDDEAALSRLYPVSRDAPYLPLGCSIPHTVDHWPSRHDTQLPVMLLLFILPIVAGSIRKYLR